MNRTGPSLIRVRTRIGTATQVSYAVLYYRHRRRPPPTPPTSTLYPNVFTLLQEMSLRSAVILYYCLGLPFHQKTDWTDHYVRPIYTLHLFVSVWFCFCNLSSLKLNMMIDLLVYFFTKALWFQLVLLFQVSFSFHNKYAYFVVEMLHRFLESKFYN